jgi:hypothetical protein
LYDEDYTELDWYKSDDGINIGGTNKAYRSNIPTTINGTIVKYIKYNPNFANGNQTKVEIFDMNGATT